MRGTAATRPRPCVVDEPMRSSPLMQKGGFDIFEGLLDAEGRTHMLAEAMSLLRSAESSDAETSDGEEFRGGSPARRFLSSAGGAVQDAFYHAQWMREFLQEITGAQVTPSGGRGTYTYYARLGDHLSLHRDVETCDLAVSTCLFDGPSLEGHGGVLCLYPNRIDEPLSAIRASPERGVVPVRLAPGQSLVMFGGIVPHSVVPVADRQLRIVSLLCYRVHAAPSRLSPAS